MLEGLMSETCLRALTRGQSSVRRAALWPLLSRCQLLSLFMLSSTKPLILALAMALLPEFTRAQQCRPVFSPPMPIIISGQDVEILHPALAFRLSDLVVAGRTVTYAPGSLPRFDGPLVVALLSSGSRHKYG